MTATEIVAVCVAVLACYMQRRIVSAGLDEARHEVSRYALFKARDALVYLVAAGEMHEDDEAWQFAYSSVNSMLDVHEKLDLWSLHAKTSRFHAALENDARLKREVELMQRKLRRARRDHPEFGHALDAIESGFVIAMVRQTTLGQLLLTKLASSIYGALRTGEAAQFANWLGDSTPAHSHA